MLEREEPDDCEAEKRRGSECAGYGSCWTRWTLQGYDQGSGEDQLERGQRDSYVATGPLFAFDPRFRPKHPVFHIA